LNKKKPPKSQRETPIVMTVAIDNMKLRQRFWPVSRSA